ncbi:MAG TPA: hypothetical protein VGB22_06230 [candidate division Zixibacteria bacterium]|jgi:hypothetical protein
MTFFYFAALAALSHAVGDLRAPIYALVSAVLIGFFWRSFPVIPQLGRGVNWLIRWSSCALAIGVIMAAGPVLRLVLLTVCAWGFDRFGQPDRRGASRPLVIAGAMYTIVWTCFFFLPVGYRWLLSWTFDYSQVVTQVMSRQLILGPSAQGIDLLLLGLSGIIGLLIARRDPQWLMAGLSLLALEAARVVYVWMAPTLANLISGAIPVSSTPHLDMPGVFCVFVAGYMALLARTTSPLPVESRAGARWSPTLAVGAAAVVLAFLIAGSPAYVNRPVRVLMPSTNMLDTGLPQYGRYGDRSGGMFGFLPIFLESCGHTVFRGEPTKELLDSVDVIFIANLQKKFDPEQRQNIYDFIAGGGGLVIVGDHTGTDAIREPTNDILAPCGLELNFDTAVPLRRSWVAAKSYLFHPLGRSGGVMDAELWLGASVTAGPKGEPFVIGRGAFSDPGDMNNAARSYLGNLEYDPGEPLGDVVLAAAAHWGKGRAVLHGDTSPYQNGTIIRSHSLINRSIRWAAPQGWLGIVDQWRLPLLFILIGILGTILVAMSVGQPIVLWTALLLPALSVGFWFELPGGSKPDWTIGQFRAAVIDEGHGNRFDYMAWEDRSVGAIEYNLFRAGYSPRFAKSPFVLDEYPAELYVTCTPTHPYTAREIGRLERFVTDGGWLVIGAGWDMRSGAKGLLERFGLSIENVPLGEADGHGMGMPVKMKNAYPIAGDPEGAEVLIEAFNYPVAKVLRRGQGGVIAIGDSEFLLNMNLEGQNDFVVLENINFLRELFASLHRQKTS